MGQVFTLAKEFIALPPGEIERLLDSPIHEVRVGALSIMDRQGRRNTTPADRRHDLYGLYLRRHDRINNWDLVDLGAPFVVATWPTSRATRSTRWRGRRTSGSAAPPSSPPPTSSARAICTTPSVSRRSCSATTTT